LKKIVYISFLLIIGLQTLCLGQKKDMIKEKMTLLDYSLQKQSSKDVLKLVHEIYQTDTILPDDAAFFLGYALYLKEQYRQSKTALLRYVSLTKESGKYFDSTKYFINKIDEALAQYDPNVCDICDILGPLPEIDTCPKCTGYGKTEQECRSCSGKGIEICPRCLGLGYEQFYDGFQTNYLTCKRCNRAGTIPCTQCNGTLKEIAICKTCSGVGSYPRPRICTHRDLEGAVITPRPKKVKSTFSR
jgi:hypothetical protein